MVTWNHHQPLQRLEMQIQTIIISSNCYSLRGQTTSNPGILHCHRKLQIVIPPTSNQKCQLTKVHFIVRVQRCIQPCRCWRTASLRVTRLTSKMTSFTLGKRIRIQCGNVFWWICQLFKAWKLYRKIGKLNSEQITKIAMTFRNKKVPAIQFIKSLFIYRNLHKIRRKYRAIYMNYFLFWNKNNFLNCLVKIAVV